MRNYSINEKGNLSKKYKNKYSNLNKVINAPDKMFEFIATISNEFIIERLNKMNCISFNFIPIISNKIIR